MVAYLIRRLAQTVPTLLGVIVLVFVLFRFFGGDPAQILGGLNATPEQIEQIRSQLGLNRPVWQQLWLFVQQVFTLDWGRSWATHETVADLFASRLPATLTVMGPILLLDTLLALPIALLVARWRGSLSDRVVMLATTLAMSVSFLVYVIVGQWLFAFRLGWFPVQGWDASVVTNLLHYAPLPVMLAVLVGVSPQTRLYRSFMLDEVDQDYVRTARAKGLGEGQILFKHVLRNALIPVVTNIGVQLPGLFVGSFLIEVFFSIPGLGREVMLAVNRSDYPVIQAVTVYLAVITMAVNLLTDLVYQWLDPRVELK